MCQAADTATALAEAACGLAERRACCDSLGCGRGVPAECRAKPADRASVPSSGSGGGICGDAAAAGAAQVCFYQVAVKGCMLALWNRAPCKLACQQADAGVAAAAASLHLLRNWVIATLMPGVKP